MYFETGTGTELINLPIYEELHNFYTSPVIIRVIKSRWMRWAGHVARMGAMRNAYSILVGKLEGKRPLIRPRSRGEDNIRIDLGKQEGANVWTGFIWSRIGTSGWVL
jgi:hypothetical protein